MLSDLRFALRQLLKSPGFSVVVVLCIAIGIGANATVLCWIRNIMHEPLHGVTQHEQLGVLVSNNGGGNISFLDSRDFDGLKDVFAGVAVSQITPASLSIGEDHEWSYGQIVSANFFSLLGVKPMLGRTFLPEEDRKPGGNSVLVLGEALWRRRFGADPAVLGKVVTLNRHAFTIIGVVPSTFAGSMPGLLCEFWAPVSMVREVASWPVGNLTWRGARPFHNVIRLQPGVSIPQAQAAVAVFDKHLGEAHPESNRGTSHRVARLAEAPWGAGALLGSALSLLLAVSLGVLLIVTANVAGLLLARAAGRQKEIAIRYANGASRWQVVRLLLVETTALSLVGGALGALLATWLVDAIRWFIPPVRASVAVANGLDAQTLLWTVFLSLLTALLCGLVPALQASKPRLNESLKDGGRTSVSHASHRLRNAFVVAELSLAIALLVGATLCVKSLRRAQQVDYGLNPKRVLTAGLQIGMNGYNEETGLVFYRQLHERLSAMPEVEQACLASWFPLGLEGCKGSEADVEGYVPPPSENRTYEYARVSPGYFSTLQVPLVAGRDFSGADDANAPLVAIVNEHFARRFWPGQDPVGRTFRALGRSRTIIGVAKAGKYHQMSEPAHPFFYLPYLQGCPDLDMMICVRARHNADAVAEGVRREVRALDPGVDLWGVIPLEAHIGGAFVAQRIASHLLTALGVVALGLAGLGVYGLMAYVVAQRTQEFGVRMALGATPANVMWQVLRRTLLLAAIGAALGLGISAALTRMLSSFLFGVSPWDPLTFLCVPLVLIGVAMAACWQPVRRAVRIDPVVALRAE